MNISSNINGENVTIKNIVGDEKILQQFIQTVIIIIWYSAVEVDHYADLSQPQIFSASVTPKIGNVYNCSKLWMARIG